MKRLRVLCNKIINQSGFTLIELLVSLVIIALIMPAIIMTFYQIESITLQSNSHMNAIRQIQNTGNYFSNDVQQAQNGVNSISHADYANSGSVQVMSVWWDNHSFGGTSRHDVTYMLSNGTLTRLDSLNSATPTSMVVATGISAVTWQGTGSALRVTISALVLGFRQSTETRIYEFKPRPS